MTRQRPQYMPNWPRRMQAPFAAAYMGVSKTKFLDGVKAGHYPKPYHDGSNTLWYIEDLDESLDRLKGNRASSGRQLVRERLNDLGQNAPRQ